MNAFRSWLLVCCVLVSISAFAQKKETLSNPEEITQRADKFLSAEFSSGELAKKAKELAISGEFILDITVYGKGQVLTVFSPNEIPVHLIKDQNRLKDLLMKCEFPFKLPKNQKVKFRHKFSFN